MLKPADHVYSIKDIRKDWYKKSIHRKQISFLAPAEDVDSFMWMCEYHNRYPWETFRILMMMAQNHKQD